MTTYWYARQVKESGPAELMLSWKGEAKLSAFVSAIAPFTHEEKFMGSYSRPAW
jgi:hypothetical protein